jgi:hypothetical protein
VTLISIKQANQHNYTKSCRRRGTFDMTLASINEVEQRPPWLMPRWVTAREYHNRQARGCCVYRNLIADGLDMQNTKYALMSPHAQHFTIHERSGSDVKWHPHRVLALMTQILMGRYTLNPSVQKQNFTAKPASACTTQLTATLIRQHH